MIGRCALVMEKDFLAGPPAREKSHQQHQMSAGMQTIDTKLANSNGLPFFLQRRIRFREAIGDDSAITSGITYAGAEAVGAKRARKRSEGLVDKNGFCEAAYELFASQQISSMMQWQRVTHIGPGLANLGNTCFLNSVLQCLTYTPPLANYLLKGEHGRRCRVEGFCLVCDLEQHLARSLGDRPDASRVISPASTVGHLKWIAKHMRVGRQEDSHEFLRFVIEGMQRNLLQGLDTAKLDARVKETTLIHQVFGGYLQSCVQCRTCHKVSSTFDPFLDLSLDVRQAETIERALRQFVQPERLSQANRYCCQQCGRLSDADKTLSIYRPPNVLTVHLKRFHMTLFGDTNKINKQIDFSPELDLTDLVTGDEKGTPIYDLYAVLVHEGHSCNSGHYHAFVKSSNGVWYSMNDSSVHQVSLATVLKQRAYLLFYTRRFGDRSGVPPAPSVKEAETDQPQSPPPREKKPDPPSTPTQGSAAPNTQLIRDAKTPPTADPPATVDQPAPAFVSSSMWHMSEPESFRLTDFSKGARATPTAGWRVALLKKMHSNHRSAL